MTVNWEWSMLLRFVLFCVVLISVSTSLCVAVVYGAESTYSGLGSSVHARKRKKKKMAEGEMSEAPAPSPATQGGHGAVSGSRRPRNVSPERTFRPPVTFNGETFYNYPYSPRRSNKPYLVAETLDLNLYGWHTVFAQGTAGTGLQDGKMVPQVLQVVKSMWDDAYDEWVSRTELTQGYAHPKATLTDKTNLKAYCETYMRALWTLIHVISCQKLWQFDDVHSTMAGVANVVSRGRIQTALQRLTSIPMIPAFHQLIVHLATPLWGGPGTPVVHKMIALSKLKNAGEKDFLDFCDSNIWNGSTALPGSGVMTDTGNDLLNSVFTGWQTKLLVVESMIAALRGTVYLSTVAAADKADWAGIRSMFRHLELPKQHLMQYDDIQPIRVDIAEYDRYFHRNAYFGVHVQTGQDAWRCYPFTSLKDDTSEKLIEIRGIGTPDPLVMTGLSMPYAGSFFNTNDVTGVHHRLLGFLGPGSEQTTDGQKNWGLRVMNEWDFDGTRTAVHSGSAYKEAPIAHHQWRNVVDKSTWVEGDTPRTVDAVDYEFFVPADSFQQNFAVWTSQALEIPYVR